MPASQLIISSLPTDRLPTTAILRCLGDGMLKNVPAKISRLEYICEDKSPPLLEKGRSAEEGICSREGLKC